MKKNQQINIKQWDALNMKQIKSGSITQIITDPPWGIYKRISDLPEFYMQMLYEFHRVLNEKGLVVIITGAKTEFETALKTNKQFKLLNQYHILVSGKKAGVYKLQKQKYAS